mmetsp:Transcript_26523/g.85721  ORF Transcript_26523/g.85721 Transcript_26523/m.85721 type:complete len:361 (-) Transcript_26523:212-1294(-)
MSAAELTAQAHATFEAGDIDSAIELFARALEEQISEHHEKHIECAPAYLEYGRALLRKAQQADDPFGSKLPREEAPKHAEPAGEAETSEAGEKPDACAGAEQNDGSDDGAEGEEGEEEAGEEAEADDLELAFQCLEMARLIYEAASGSDLPLADVLECLGEVQMENEMWAEAVAELEKSLALKQKHLPADHRQLAHLHYQIATATVSLIESLRQKVKDHFEQAAGVLRQRLGAVGAAGNGSSDGTEGEGSELRDLLAEIEERVKEHSQENNLPPVVSPEVPPASTTSIGFGSVSLRATDGSVTTIGFGAPAVPSAAVQHLGVVGRAAGRKKAVLEPIPNVSNNPAEAMQPTCVSKKARIE